MGNATMFHPHTGAPIVPLWIRPDGREMWPIMGASPDDPPPSDPPPADPPSSDPPPADPPQDPAADPAKGGKDAILADLAKERDKRQALEEQVQELLPLRDQFAAIAKVFGGGDDEPPDPAKLAEQVAAEQGKTETEKARADSAERALAVFKRALDPQAGLNVNPIALLDSNTFLTSLKDVDHADVEKLDGAIKAAIEANPLLKSSSPTPPFPGGPRPSAPTRAGSMDEAIANKLAAARPR